MTGEITAIVAVRRRGRDRADVYLDGAPALSLAIALVIELRVGQELTEPEVRALQARDVAEAAYEAALHYLAYRPRSEQELERYLQGKGVEPGVIPQVMERLRRLGLADDQQFAEFWVENREAFRPRGQWALRQELGQKGVRAEVIAQAVAEVDDAQNAQQVAERMASRYAHLDQDTFRRRMIAVLLRRGFGYGVARGAVERAWQQLNPAAEDGE